MGEKQFKQKKIGKQKFEVYEGEDGAALSGAKDEEALLSICLNHPAEGVAAAMTQGIRAEVLAVPRLRTLWELLVERVECGAELDQFSLQRVLERRGQLADVGGHQGLSELAVLEGTLTTLPVRVRAVKAAAERRAADAAGKALREAAADPNADTVEAARTSQAQLARLQGAETGETGLAVPAEGDARPKVQVSQPVGALAAQMGELLGARGFYRRAETRLVVTVDAMGRVEPMTAKRFRGGCEKWIYPVQWDPVRERDVARSMTDSAAATILETDEFLHRLPELRGVARVRMPVRRGGKVVLARKGFDPETGIYCVGEVPFREDLSLAEATAQFHELLQGFQFASAKQWHESRSGLLHVAVMVGTFCRWLLPGGVPRPMVSYIGNQPGTGKTLMASMAMCHVDGPVASEDFPAGSSGQEELKKMLDVAAIEQATRLWFDDVPESIASNALNRFVTASRHNPRILGRSEKIDVANQCQVFLTGNHLKITRDLIRRALVVELFVAGEIEEREFEVELTQRLLATPEWRAKMLAACWALVREWGARGAELREAVPLKGFADYCALVGGIMQVIDPAEDPLAFPDLPMSGDEETEQMKKLLAALAAEAATDEARTAFTMDEIVEVARRQEVSLTDRRGRDIVGRPGDEPLQRAERTAMGKLLKKWRGRQVTTEAGRFEFGMRKQAQAQVYPVRIL